MNQEYFKQIASNIGISFENFMMDCINGSIFIFNETTLYEFWKEAELNISFENWKKHELKELYRCDNKEDYTKFMCDHFLISEDEEYFYNMQGQITLIFYVS